ncbi:MBL fold metallo-hydrolase [Pseudarthrobacter oxydans]|uniref:MBL fold metallo-hydrolase n=1 Tax=Pseudarthrobacter oxydans TaxID=1671 RepID=UPI003805AA3F
MSAVLEERGATWLRFRFGSFRCTVVSDGVLELGSPETNFPGHAPGEVRRLLENLGLPTDQIRLEQNILIVDTGANVVMFDSGVGSDPAWGQRRFGTQTGQLLTGLAAAGIDPASIDTVVITHAHPDHVWGLVNEHGQKNFPTATVAISRTDFAHFTDTSTLGPSSTGPQTDRIEGARRNLLPYESGLRLFEGDATIVPGITSTATPGHSPGHSVFTVTSDGASFVFWGDLCHHEVLLRHPQWSVVFDHDAAAAATERLRILGQITEQKLDVLSYHFAFPGFGALRTTDDGYEWVRQTW